MGSLFKPATATISKARIALCGASGSGKTYSALAIAEGLGGNIVCIDTERGSAAKYGRNFAFDHLDMASWWSEEAESDPRVRQEGPFAIRRYILAINEAGKAGYGVCIIDSLTHAWSGEGGALSMVDHIQSTSKNPNAFAAWRDVTPWHNRLIDAMLGSPCHIIATMRSKTEYAMDKDDRGRTQVKKIGMAPIQRDGMDYEFDVLGELDERHKLVVTKTRCPDLDNAVVECPGRPLGEVVLSWCSQGEAPLAKPRLEAKFDGAALYARYEILTTGMMKSAVQEALLPIIKTYKQRNVIGMKEGAWPDNALREAEQVISKIEKQAASIQPVAGPEPTEERMLLIQVLLDRQDAFANTPAEEGLSETWANVARREGTEEMIKWSNRGLAEVEAALDDAMAVLAQASPEVPTTEDLEMM